MQCLYSKSGDINAISVLTQPVYDSACVPNILWVYQLSITDATTGLEGAETDATRYIWVHSLYLGACFNVDSVSPV